jgi:ParB/RepB/Spo0J family partition protein
VTPKIEEIPLSEFDLSLSRMRVMNIARTQQVQRSMQLHGQLQPVVARICEKGYQVIDGLKRVYIANDLFMNTLQCLVLEVDEAQAKVLMLSYNRTPQTMETWEEALVLKDLVERHHVSQRELSTMIGYSRSWVSRRLALIERIDEDVTSQIRMGVLSGSQARALMKLPRGNQLEIAHVIISRGLTSRQSGTLVDAFLGSENEDQQRYLLTHPQMALLVHEPEIPCDVDDPRLSRYGNDLIKSALHVLSTIKHILTCLHERGFGALKENEKIIISPEIKKVQGQAESLTKAIAQIYKS